MFPSCFFGGTSKTQFECHHIVLFLRSLTVRKYSRCATATEYWDFTRIRELVDVRNCIESVNICARWCYMVRLWREEIKKRMASLNVYERLSNKIRPQAASCAATKWRTLFSTNKKPHYAGRRVKVFWSRELSRIKDKSSQIPFFCKFSGSETIFRWNLPSWLCKRVPERYTGVHIPKKAIHQRIEEGSEKIDNVLPILLK